MDDVKPSFWYFQMVGVTILLIGGSISGIILVIGLEQEGSWAVSYTHLRAHETQ